MVSTKIRLIIFFAAKDGEALYSQQKQDQELTVAQIMNSLLPNSDLSKKVGIFIPIPMKDNAKECSNYHTIAFLSRSSGEGNGNPL